LSSIPVLCIAGGGTGGHVMPALALADAAREQWPELKVEFIGAERGFEARLLPERGESVLLLTMHGVKGVDIWQKLHVLLWELPQAVQTIRRSWRNQRPDLLVGVGGYASVSGVVAALISRIPVVLYEQNAMPGLVNRQLARLCRSIMLGFEAAKKHFGSHVHAVVTGNIVRQSINEIRWQAHKPPCLLVLGGSQGARFLNQTVPEACTLLAEKGRVFSIRHIGGSDEVALEQVRNCYKKACLESDVMSFCDDMAAFYASGDLMIARAGAMTVSEAAICGMPSIFVPLPHAADDHQRYNAESMGLADAACVLDQKHMTAETFAAEIERYLFDPERLQHMSRAALAIAPCDARQRQLDVLSNYLPVSEPQL